MSDDTSVDGAGRVHFHNPKPLSPPCWCGWPHERLGREADRAADRATYPAPVPEFAVEVTLDGPWDWWLRPVRKQLEVCVGSVHKPLAEVTVDEVLSWWIVGCYSYIVGTVAGRVIQRLVT